MDRLPGKMPTYPEFQAAIEMLRDNGFGIIAPNGDCIANVGYFPDGALKVSTRRKPIYGMLSVHEVAT